jgi:hypothetical protein
VRYEFLHARKKRGRNEFEISSEMVKCYYDLKFREQDEELLQPGEARRPVFIHSLACGLYFPAGKPSCHLSY